MKIIINASNLRVGGALQVTLSTIMELSAFPEHEFYVFLSPAFDGLIQQEIKDLPNVILHWVDYPCRISFLGKVKQLDTLEKEIGADRVFSIFGPTYWKPKAPHLAGFAQGYYLYNHLPYFKSLGFLAKVRQFVVRSYHRLLLQWHVDEFVVETVDVKTRLSNFLGLEESIVNVATNTYSSYFSNFSRENGSKIGTPFRLLTIAHPYPHKNLEIFKPVSDLVNKEKIACQFYITVPDLHYKEFFKGYEDSIINLGQLKNSDCPKAYEQCDAMILPSLVECFSASYPEAMKMERPILTSDYSFARTVCGKAALYFDPLNPADIADKIRKLTNDEALYLKLVSEGSKQLESFLSPAERCTRYIDILLKMRQ